MRRVLLITILALNWSAIFAQSPAADVSLAPGTIHESVSCASDPAQTYALYLPTTPAPQKGWPVIYCLDPGARGRLPVTLFREGAQRYGFLLAGSNNSRNGPVEPNLAAIATMWKDTHSRFPVDPKMVFLAGMSGGARFALGVAARGDFAGVVACAAAFQESVPARVLYWFFGTAGVDDFNFPELRLAHSRLDALGVPNRIVTFQGGHDWPPSSVCTQAIEWLLLQSMKAGLRPRDEILIDDIFRRESRQLQDLAREGEQGELFLAYQAFAGSFAGLRDVSAFEQAAAGMKDSPTIKKYFKNELEELDKQRRFSSELYTLWTAQQDVDTRQAALSAFASRVGQLQRSAAGPMDSAERRVARRTLYGLFVRGMEQADVERGRNRMASAMSNLNFAAAMQPDSPRPLYQLALTCAQAGDRSHALEWLRKAVGKGFRDADAIARNPAFDALRSSPEFQSILEKMVTGTGVPR
jgi:hypothetical protein